MISKVPRSPSSPIEARTLLRLAAAFCWLLIAAGGITFGFFFVATPTRWFWLNLGDNELLGWRDSLVLQDKLVEVNTTAVPSAGLPGGPLKPRPLLPGTHTIILIWQWCGTLSVALGAAGLRWIYLTRDASETTAAAATAADKSHEGMASSNGARSTRAGGSTSTLNLSYFRTFITKLLMGFRRLLRYQIPPRRLWRWLLGPSGLSLFDMLLVLVWLGVHLMWLHELTMKTLDRRRMAPPTPSTFVDEELLARLARRERVDVRRRVLQQGVAPLAAYDGSSTVHDGVHMSGDAGANTFNPPSPVLHVPPLTHVVHERVAKLGWAAHSDILLLFFPLARCSFLHWILGSDFASLVKYHRWLGQGTVFAYTMHGVIFLSIWARDGILSTMLSFNMSAIEFNAVAGLVALCGAWLLWLVSLPIVRRRIFNLFYCLHILGACVFLLFGFMHHKELVVWVMAGILLYLLDVVLRTLQQNFNCVRLLSIPANGKTESKMDLSCASIARVSPDGGVLSLSIRCHESLRWVGADLVFLNVPAVSWWQWHPFTIASAPAAVSPPNSPGVPENRIELRIKKFSRWTKALVTRLSDEPRSPLTLYVSGPYDSGNRKWITQYDVHVFIAGGIGITPALGLLSEVIAFHRRRRAAAAATTAAAEENETSTETTTTANNKNTVPAVAAEPRAVLIWISRSMDELNVLPYEVLEEASRGNDSCVDLRLYLSGRAPKAMSGCGKAGGDAVVTIANVPSEITAAAPLATAPAAATSATANVAAIASTGDATGTGADVSNVAESSTATAANAGSDSAASAETGAARPLSDLMLGMPDDEYSEPYTRSTTRTNFSRATTTTFSKNGPVKAFATKGGILDIEAATAENTARRAEYRLMSHPYMFNPLLWMVCVALVFGGGFAGLLCSQAYDVYMDRTITDRLRNDFSYVGMLQFLAIGLGAVIPPLVLMLGVHLHWKSTLVHRRPSTSCRTLALRSSISDISIGGYKSTVGTIDPQARGIAKGTAEVCIESYITFGRPDLSAFLEHLSRTGNIGILAKKSGSEASRGLQQDKEKDPEATAPVPAVKSSLAAAEVEARRVAIYAAGPEPMVEAVADLCASMNGVWGRTGRAYLHFTPATHEL